jgi:uncharacterized membrane protein
MEGLIGLVLLAGVLVSVALILAGLLWQWASTGSPATDNPIAGMNVAEFAASEIGEVVHGHLEPPRLVHLGILTLLLTPYVRVLASVISFAFAKRDWKYTAITAFVLAVLTYSLFLR